MVKTGIQVDNAHPIDENEGSSKILELALTQKVALAEDVLIQELSGESVLLNLETEQYFGLDEVGSRMLSVLNDMESIQAASAILQAEYDVDPDKLQKDLLELIQKCAEHGLVKVIAA